MTGRGKGRWREAEAEAETGTGEGGGGALAVVETGGRRGAQRGYQDMAWGVKDSSCNHVDFAVRVERQPQMRLWSAGMTRCVRVCGGNRRIAGQSEIANQLVSDLELEVWAFLETRGDAALILRGLPTSTVPMLVSKSSGSSSVLLFKEIVYFTP
ncbi:hypothetical protein [Oryza sativa Japonica Group]|uniref:Uncharacterized protein n=2 Tax=Oryza sativa subsp. japonica TaxID=39947 RepID=Q5JNA8_ORYSJ|nr:hypothetical protein [Oryza sativa Japonica Group]BAD88407.1 hypothetical protein [Oryza sativa Japonica Group]